MSSTTTVPPLLLPEALGISPQLLLDDIINIVNNAVTDAVNGMEEFLQRWADDRAQREAAAGRDSEQAENELFAEVEQGLVSFQTLLEYHTDIAFDFFEAWSLRNIFAVPPDLPYVLPHQEGHDLTQTPERENELINEIDELRKQLDDQRRLRRVLTHAVRVSRVNKARAAARHARLSFLHSAVFDDMDSLPAKLMALHNAASSLAEVDPALLAQVPPPDPGKRPWETNKAGYLNWAVGQLLERGTTGAEGRRTRLDEETDRVREVGEAENLRGAIQSMESQED
ncbi:hypothetical protein HGRIS_006820 [Hohenbuehelia grisea]|uniref:Mis12-domain-containing protein n=1 Tax=Hohenbuehelia grisea TaxID=104357 RepID=A0ABR3JA67_9AGAR